MAEEKTLSFPHNISVDERHNISITGVTDIGGYDEQTIVAFTQFGEVTVKGEGLHIIRMSVEMGELVAEGTINSINYSEMKQRDEGFFSRLFK
ncbi:MAG: sporulation protein YabP [Clostridia bacterium]|nr:sporulation protein YabP [Clostridia bacterium]